MNQINEIKTIYNRDAECDEDGNLISPATAKSGYHVNTIYPVDEWEEYLTQPSTPYNIFAPPSTTYFYVFADEDEWFEQSAQFRDEDGNLSLPPILPKPPKSVTRRQAKEALIRVGMLSQVETVLETIEDNVERIIAKNYYEESNEFERDNPILNSLATEHLGMTEGELDDLFRLAETL